MKIFGAPTSRSVARRLTLRAIVLLSVVLLLISTVIGILAERNAKRDVLNMVDGKIQSIIAVTEASDAMTRGMLLRAFAGLEEYFGETVIFNEETGELISRGLALNNNVSIVDRFSLEGGRVATIFVRKGDDFVRISSSLKKEDGERATGTMMDRQHPAYRNIMAGESFTGRAMVFGTSYMTHYKPMLDDKGKVVGVLFAGADITLFDQSLAKQIAAVRFFETGGMYVIDPRSSLADAVFIVHPTGAGKKVLEVYPDVLPYLTALSSAEEGQLRENMNLMGTEAQDQWSFMRKVPANHWWVVAQISDAEAMAEFWEAMRTIWGLLILAAVLQGIGLFITIRRTISYPLADLTKTVIAVSDGDLTYACETDREDEIGILIRAVDAMRKQYLEILQQVRMTAYSVHTASTEISSGSHDLSSRTEQTASSLQQTAASMVQLTTIVQHSAQAAQEANVLAASACTVAENGGRVVGEVVTTMEGINESSRRIVDIIGVINGIAFQTNILALNAAVEAARAGEQGRGFAVVASEVRNLAQRSAQAALEIKELISGSVEKVSNGTLLVEKAGQTMGEIVTSVQRVSKTLVDITSATAEQAQGIRQVNIAVAQLDEMTQQNAALVEESTAASESLQEQAGQLTNAIKVFRLGDAMMVPAAVYRGGKVVPPPQRQLSPQEATALASMERIERGTQALLGGDDEVTVY